MKVSEDHGKVKQRYKGTSSKTVIHIQDAHTSFEAQQNLAAIIKDLIANDTTPLIGVEGGVGEIDVDPFRSFPVKEARDAVSR